MASPDPRRFPGVQADGAPYRHFAVRLGVGRMGEAEGLTEEEVLDNDPLLGYTNISALRQQIKPDERVHGIILGSERWVTNVVPDYAKLSYGIRAPIKADKDLLRDRVYKCFKAAAEATGCKMKLKETMSYADLKNNSLLADRFLEYMKDEEGMDLSGELPTQGSTDFGDVSYALPAIHPIYAIPVGPGEGNHTPGFTKCAKGEPAHKETLKVAKGLAWSGWRIFVDEDFAKSVKKEWEDMDKSS